MSSPGDLSTHEDVPLLGEDVPVIMPVLPPHLTITSAQQFKALSDTTRTRIIAIIQQQPMTAKQIAEQLGIAPGTSGHHLQVLEAAGLVRVVARRLVRGIVAKYYTRTARLFLYDLPPEITSNSAVALNFLTAARNELLDALVQPDGATIFTDGFPHARIARARAEVFTQRIAALIAEFAEEPVDPSGELVGLSVAFFRSPEYLQVNVVAQAPAMEEE